MLTKFFSPILVECFDFRKFDVDILDHLCHQKSFLKETFQHYLLIGCPRSERLELSIDMAWVVLKFLKQISFDWNIGIEITKEDKVNVFIKFQIDVCFLFDSFQLSNQFLH